MSDAAPTAPASRWLGRRFLIDTPGVRVPSYTALLYAGSVVGIVAGTAAAGAAGLDGTAFALTAVALTVPVAACARLLFVLQHMGRFRAEPGRVWRRGEGGSSLYGGLIGGVAASFPLLALAGLPFAPFWDAAAVAMLAGMVVARFGCLMHGCCAGRATAGPLGVRLPDHRGVWRRRYPSQLLEAAWAAVLLGAVLAMGEQLSFAGARFAFVTGAYAAGRIVLETTREQDGRTASRVNHALSIALVLAAGAFLIRGSLV